ncbi:acyl-CoA thioesterase [Pimelobacter simplex]|uniref:acyl-CoA thioesterase n=1 Tax=Nocardioides simplex TaxID=2045 RepID=UPI00366FC368
MHDQQPYEAQISVRWSDIDALGHLANSKYLEYASHVRFQFLRSRGVDETAGCGAVVLSETIAYRKEIRPGSTVTITLHLGAARRDGSRYELRQEIRNDHQVAATLTATGAWLALEERRLVVPPSPTAAALFSMPRSNDFRWLD